VTLLQRGSRRNDRIIRLKAHKNLLREIPAMDGREESLCVWIAAAANNDNLLGIRHVEIKNTKPVAGCHGMGQHLIPDQS
jgi:hypothetical protein